MIGAESSNRAVGQDLPQPAVRSVGVETRVPERVDVVALERERSTGHPQAERLGLGAGEALGDAEHVVAAAGQVDRREEIGNDLRALR